MQRITAILTILALGVHLALGCCAHHHHAEVVADGEVWTAVVQLPSERNHGHEHCGRRHVHLDFGSRSSDEHQEHDGPAEHDLICLGDGCTYLAGRVVQVDSSDDQGPDRWASDPAAVGSVVAAAIDSFSASQHWSLAARDAAPPVRAHLLLQVLLI